MPELEAAGLAWRTKAQSSQQARNVLEWFVVALPTQGGRRPCRCFRERPCQMVPSRPAAVMFVADFLKADLALDAIEQEAAEAAAEYLHILAVAACTWALEVDSTCLVASDTAGST